MVVRLLSLGLPKFIKEDDSVSDSDSDSEGINSDNMKAVQMKTDQKLVDKIQETRALKGKTFIPKEISEKVGDMSNIRENIGENVTEVFGNL